MTFSQNMPDMNRSTGSVKVNLDDDMSFITLVSGRVCMISYRHVNGEFHGNLSVDRLSRKLAFELKADPVVGSDSKYQKRAVTSIEKEKKRLYLGQRKGKTEKLGVLAIT